MSRSNKIFLGIPAAAQVVMFPLKALGVVSWLVALLPAITVFSVGLLALMVTLIRYWRAAAKRKKVL